MLIMFDDMVADMEAKKKIRPIVTGLFLRGREFFHMFFYHNFISKYLKL